MARARERRRGRRPSGGRVPGTRSRVGHDALFYGLLALLTALFVVAAWATLAEETPPRPLAAERPTSTATRAPPSPTATTLPTTPTPAVVLVERRAPTNTPRATPSDTPTPSPSPTATASPTTSPQPAPSGTQTPTGTPTETPTETPMPTPTPQPPTPAPVVHVVQPGDTLRAIGERYGVAWQAIAAANGLPLDTVLRPEQRLVIPQE
ncbi:MAG TPA: LysM peptidoglycan-binding domain-containing protein [Chloroflexota bacterium]|nr:LysM peptidoglycan-binding domain-containing protein [Chloroflexota bacterium]